MIKVGILSNRYHAFQEHSTFILPLVIKYTARANSPWPNYSSDRDCNIKQKSFLANDDLGMATEDFIRILA